MTILRARFRHSRERGNPVVEPLSSFNFYSSMKEPKSIMGYYCNTIARMQHFKNQRDSYGKHRKAVAFDTAGKGENTNGR
jgi:hypothetical protein